MAEPLRRTGQQAHTIAAPNNHFRSPSTVTLSNNTAAGTQRARQQQNRKEQTPRCPRRLCRTEKQELGSDAHYLPNIQDGNIPKNRATEYKGEREESTPPDLREKRRGGAFQNINTETLLLILKWVLISTATLCVYTHHPTLILMLTTTIYPPRYHHMAPPTNTYSLSRLHTASSPTKPPHW